MIYMKRTMKLKYQLYDDDKQVAKGTMKNLKIDSVLRFSENISRFIEKYRE